MARCPRAAFGILLVLTMLGVVRARGSGSRGHAEQPPPAGVLGVVEMRDGPVASTSPTTPSSTVVVQAPPEMMLAPPPIAAPFSSAATEGGAVERLPASSTDERAVDALARISYPWRDRLPGWSVHFLDARQGMRGLTMPHQRRIEIYVRDGDTATELARVLAHELGHAVDVARNDSRDRDAWRRARGAAWSVPWWPNDRAPDDATLAGDFAEAFAHWQVGSASRSTAAGPLTDDHLRLVAFLAS